MFEEKDIVMLLGMLGGMVLLLVLAVGSAASLMQFRRELRYLNDEIARSHHRDERKYWKRQRRRLWLSLIPFVPYNRD